MLGEGEAEDVMVVVVVRKGSSFTMRDICGNVAVVMGISIRQINVFLTVVKERKIEPGKKGNLMDEPRHNRKLAKRYKFRESNNSLNPLKMHP